MPLNMFTKQKQNNGYQMKSNPEQTMVGYSVYIRWQTKFLLRNSETMPESTEQGNLILTNLSYRKPFSDFLKPQAWVGENVWGAQFDWSTGSGV